MAQRYQRHERVGHGRFSDVYSGTDVANPRQVALKVTDPLDESPPHNSRFELALLRNLHHDHVIAVLDHYETLDELVMVLPFYQFTLADVIRSHCKRRIDFDNGAGSYVTMNKMPHEKAVDILRQLASALAYVHSQGVIHRDVKPENVLFESLESSKLVLADFGICWIAPDNHGKEPPRHKIIDVATGIYKAPELIFGVTSYTEAVDIWALGVLMTELFSTTGGPILTDAGSDLALLGSILHVFGTTAAMREWDEVRDTQSFQAMSFMEQDGLPVQEILPRCNDERIYTVFSKMMVYESSHRLRAADIVQQLLSMN